MRTGEEFKKQAAAIGLEMWLVRPCSICGSWVGFVFRQGEVCWDGSCSCSTPLGLQPRTWDDVAECYNRQSVDSELIKRMDLFWHFEPVES